MGIVVLRRKSERKGDRWHGAAGGEGMRRTGTEFRIHEDEGICRSTWQSCAGEVTYTSTLSFLLPSPWAPARISTHTRGFFVQPCMFTLRFRKSGHRHSKRRLVPI